MTTTTALTFGQRAQQCRNPAAAALLTLMDEKQSNLCVNPDVRSKEELLRLADAVGPEICLLKTHIDMIDDFDQELPLLLRELAKKHRFLLFEDRKFGDIGHVVRAQYGGGIHKIASWADITNAHPVPGPGIVEGLKEVGLPLNRGLLLVAQMSSQGALAAGAYTEAAVNMAESHTDFVIGFICQKKLVDNPAFLHLTPGVSLDTTGDGLGQQYNSPEEVIAVRGSDIAIVGRAVIGNHDPRKEAARYRAATWHAYTQRL